MMPPLSHMTHVLICSSSLASSLHCAAHSLHRPVVCVSVQVPREAFFTGQSYLELNLTNSLSLKNNFYAGFGFRTDQKEGLMLYHRDKVRLSFLFSASLHVLFGHLSHTHTPVMIVSAGRCLPGVFA